jgi:hypothetical protein
MAPLVVKTRRASASMPGAGSQGDDGDVVLLPVPVPRSAATAHLNVAGGEAGVAQGVDGGFVPLAILHGDGAAGVIGLPVVSPSA